MDGLVVSRSFHIADNTESHRETILVAHGGQLQLQGVVLAMGIVYENIVHRDAVLANLHHFQSETILHQAILVVLTEDELLTVTHIDAVLFATLLGIDGVVAAVVEDDAVLQNLADGGSFGLRPT